jgi:DNA modification methylase
VPSFQAVHPAGQSSSLLSLFVGMHLEPEIITTKSGLTVAIYAGDCLSSLRRVPDASVQTCVTSPPYFGLRHYGVDGQMGLEPTPDAYVAKMVEVFAEVRRVLRNDGTLWLNLGDSYAGSGKGGNPEDSPHDKQRTNRGTLVARQGDRMQTYGLKPKDLIGIPWMVAKALQAPYYTGSIKDERDRIWLAAMLDAEGCMFIHKRKAGQHNGQGYYRQNANYAPGVEIANTSLAVVERIMALVGKGSICSQGPEQNARRKQRIYRWNLRTGECRNFVRELYPYLVAKQQQARILLGCPSSGERAEAAHAALIALHRTGASGVDFSAPPSMFEKGYYLRSDIIWAKGNPMPESVTDRPTKAHEHLFLLAKSERYYYDAEAIAERSAYPGDNRALRTDTRKAVDPMCMDGGSRARTGKPTALTRNKRDVWTVAPANYPGAHFATFPPKLIEPCIKAGCPQGGTVLDPFGGAFTTAQVALELGCNAVICELNPAYIEMGKRRIAAEAAQGKMF